jgi:hypothetical protein
VNGVIDNGDYVIWQQHFGWTASGSGSAVLPGVSVPEPSTIVSFLIASICLKLFRGNRARRKVSLAFAAGLPPLA